MKKNPTEQTKDLTIDGVIYTLFFSFDAVAQAEEATELPLILGLRHRDINAPRVSLVRAMLWACLLPHRPTMTLAEASALVNLRNLHEVWAVVLNAWVAGMKEQREAAGDPPKGQS